MQGMLHYCEEMPEILAELREEVDAVWDGQELITRELFKLVPKCRAFVMEVMRLAPPVANAMRTSKSDMEIDGYLVPAGTTVSLNLHSVVKRAYGVDTDKMQL